MIIPNDVKPCLVQARQGFSVLYRDRYLYSRYNPEDAIKKHISSVEIAPETLIFCYAPAAGYGLSELINKIPENTFIVTIDFDPALHDFFIEQNSNLLSSSSNIIPLLLRSPSDIARIMAESNRLPSPGKYRRIQIIEMSAGTALNKEDFSETTRYADDFIMSFWKNHITLTRMGRMYALDILRNIRNLPASKPLIKGSVSKTILVIGAGLSADNIIPFIKNHRKNFFILAVDAVLPALIQNGMKPDAVIAVECQLAIEKAYIGAAGSGIHMIADLTSRPHVTELCGGNVSYFLSDYCVMPFLKEIRQLAEVCSIPVFPSLGSVGIYAVETALFLRKQETPVFLAGLDFSFLPGQTHCKGAPAHTASLINANRLSPAGNPGSAYRFTAHSFIGKGGMTEYTDAALSGYGKLHGELCRNTKNLFDCTRQGMASGIPYIQPDQMVLIAAEWNRISGGAADFFDKSDLYARPLTGWMDEQKKKLRHIRDILTGSASDINAEESINLMKECGYLYSHFPDSSDGFRNTPDFIKRIRAELNLFIKATDPVTLP